MRASRQRSPAASISSRSSPSARPSSASAWPQWSRRKRSAGRASAAQGTFPARSSLPSRRSKSHGRLAPRWRPGPAPSTRSDLALSGRRAQPAATARGAKILGVLAGCGEMADSFHRTRSSPDGKAIIGCIRNAIADAGIAPDDIDYINPHGTGTPENDKMEYLGVSSVFGERARSIPISSNKSMIGHTLSAAGTVETVFTLLTLEHQRLPPTINYKIPDPAIPLDVVR